nr:MAG TPA: hypothetical protein [Caudoviricetes sp.]
MSIHILHKITRCNVLFIVHIVQKTRLPIVKSTYC